MISDQLIFRFVQTFKQENSFEDIEYFRYRNDHNNLKFYSYCNKINTLIIVDLLKNLIKKLE